MSHNLEDKRRLWLGAWLCLTTTLKRSMQIRGFAQKTKCVDRGPRRIL